ncbi:MAG: TOBE domain-containing protein [Candidatus Geothermarchaeales archaeon]
MSKVKELTLLIEPNFRVWLEYGGEAILGKGGATILENVSRYGNLSRAAKEASISYRYAWNYLKKIRDVTGVSTVETRRGGYGGGGGVTLTKLGQILLKKYKRFRDFLKFALGSPELWEALGLRTKEGSKLRGLVVNVEEGGDAVMVDVEVEPPVLLTSIITRRSAEELGLSEGDRVKAVVKATEAMIDIPGEESYD